MKFESDMNRKEKYTTKLNVITEESGKNIIHNSGGPDWSGATRRSNESKI